MMRRLAPSLLLFAAACSRSQQHSAPLSLPAAVDAQASPDRDDDTCTGDAFGLAPGALETANALIAKKRGSVGRAPHRMVATSHRLATEAGLEVLRNGGNAADAFVAATLVQDVVLPGVTSTAGLAGVLVYEAKTRSVTYIHGGLADAVDPAARYRHGDTAVGRLVLVPGAPAAYAATAKRFGTKALRELVKPAARVAAEGFPADALYAGTIARRRELLARSAYGRATFFHGEKPIAKGETIKLPEVAKTLRAFGDDALYFQRGAWPRDAAALVTENGGTLVARDFENYAPEISPAMHGRFMDHDVYGAGHGGGKLIVALEALERLLRVQHTVNALPFLHDRMFLSDGSVTDEVITASADAVIRTIAAGETPGHPTPPGTHSSAVVVVDGKGNVVVGTHTIETLPWGEGLFVGGVPLSTAAPAGLDDATKATSRVRADGLSNTIVLRDGRVRAALGIYGTGLHPADVQILDAVLARGKGAEDAVLEPRVGYVQFDAERGKVDATIHSVDPRFATPLLCTLKKRGFMLERSMPGYPPGIVDTGFPTLVTIARTETETEIEGMTPELMSGVAAGD